MIDNGRLLDEIFLFPNLYFPTSGFRLWQLRGVLATIDWVRRFMANGDNAVATEGVQQREAGPAGMEYVVSMGKEK